MKKNDNTLSVLLLFILLISSVVSASSEHNTDVTAKDFLLFIRNRANYLAQVLLNSKNIYLDRDTIIALKNNDISEKLLFRSDSIFNSTKAFISVSVIPDTLNHRVCKLSIMFTDSNRFSLPQLRSFTSEQVTVLDIVDGKKYAVKIVDNSDKSSGRNSNKKNRFTHKEKTGESSGIPDSVKRNVVGNWQLGMTGEWIIEDVDEVSEIGSGFSGAEQAAPLDFETEKSELSD